MLYNEREVVMIGAPWCEGQNLEGADLAPLAMREAGLHDAIVSLGHTYRDMGDIDFSTVALSDHRYSVSKYREWQAAGSSDNFAAWMRKNSGMSRKRSHEAAMSEQGGSKAASRSTSGRPVVNVMNAELMGCGLKLVHEAVRGVLGSSPSSSPTTQVPSSFSQSPFVLTVGGDHSIASASISASIARYPELGVIWVDAHADANTPRSSPSGHYHGMPAAHLLGWFDKEGEMGDGVPRGTQLSGFEWFRSGCLQESKLAYIGLRDVDVEEGRMLRRSGVRVFTMRDVDKHGIARVIEMAIEAVGPSMDCPLHLSLDIDSVDPHFAPGTGTAARGGLSYREIHYICEEAALSRRLVSMDLVEVNPGLDPPSVHSSEGDEHAEASGGVTGPSMHGDHPAIQGASPTVRLALELVLSALGKQIC